MQYLQVMSPKPATGLGFDVTDESIIADTLSAGAGNTNTNFVSKATGPGKGKGKFQMSGPPPPLPPPTFPPVPRDAQVGHTHTPVTP